MGIIACVKLLSRGNSGDDAKAIGFRKVISYIGKQSLTIYIFHGYFTRAFTLLMKMLFLTLALPGIFSTFIGTTSSFLLYYLILQRSKKTLFLVGGGA